MKKVLCVLDPSVTAGSNHVPLADVVRPQKRKGNEEEESEFCHTISQAMGTLGYATLISKLSKAKKEKVGAQLSMLKAQSDEEKKVWRDVMADAVKTVKELEAKKEQYN